MNGSSASLVQMVDTTRHGKWLVPLRTAGEARVALLLFAHAGAGASTFSRWGEMLAPGIAAWAVQLPGREGRQNENPYRCIGQFSQAFELVLESFADKPLVLFGHSMGAILAFDTAQQLRSKFGHEPRHLIVSAMAGPDHKRMGKRHMLSDDQLAQDLMAMRGEDDPDFQQDKAVRYILPVVRADFAIIETYRRGSNQQKLSCPITAITALRDNVVKPERVASWRSETTGMFYGVEVDGDHFYLSKHYGDVITLLNAICLE